MRRRRLFGESESELVEQQALAVVGLRVARQDEFAPADVGRWTSTIWMAAYYANFDACP